VTAPTLLLVPHPIHATDLLNEGPAGGRPPLAHRQLSRPDRWILGGGYETDALVLRLDGKPCALGVARLAEVIVKVFGGDIEKVFARLWGWLLHGESPPAAVSIFGTLLRLGADGREGE